MNRHLAMYEWVGGSPELTHATPYIFWVMMDVEPHREALFNELYDKEHLPLLMKLPARSTPFATAPRSRRAALSGRLRGRADRPADVEAWNDTSDIGRWKPEVRPYTYNKRYIVSERVWPK